MNMSMFSPFRQGLEIGQHLVASGYLKATALHTQAQRRMDAEHIATERTGDYERQQLLAAGIMMAFWLAATP